MPNSNSEQDQLKKALGLYQEQWLAELPTEQELDFVSFSPAFEKKMDKLIFRQKHPFLSRINTTGKRVACLLVVAFLALTVSVFSVRAIANPVIDFFVHVYEKFSTIVFSQQENASSVLFEALHPAALPDGFCKDGDTLTDAMYHCRFVNDSGGELLFYQSFCGDTQMNVDTESTSSENIRVRGTTGIYFEKNGMHTIVWSDSCYCYMISGNLEREQLLAIAESLQPAQP